MLAGWDRYITGLAETQYALVSNRQLRDAGYSRDTIWEWRRAGVLENMTEGVYRIPGSPRSWEQRLYAWCSPAGRWQRRHTGLPPGSWAFLGSSAGALSR